jgi:hypothetical protein
MLQAFILAEEPQSIFSAEGLSCLWPLTWRIQPPSNSHNYFVCFVWSTISCNPVCDINIYDQSSRTLTIYLLISTVVPFHLLCKERYKSVVNHWIPPTVAVGSVWFLEYIVLVDCVNKRDRIVTKLAHHAIELGFQIAFCLLTTGLLRQDASNMNQSPLGHFIHK